MADDPFESARRKLRRAEVHFEELDRLANQERERQQDAGQALFRLQREYRRQSRCIVVSVVDVRATDPHWGVIVGDILHNLRSALDNVAWELVCRGQRPPETLTDGMRRSVKFPIESTRDGYNRAVPQLLPGVPRSQLAVVRSVQPYHYRSKRLHMHPLWVLQKFSNADKHREVQTTYYRPFESTYAIPPERVVDFSISRVVQMPPGPMEPGAELVRIYGRREGPNPDCIIDIDSGADLALGGGYWLSDTVASSIQWTAFRVISRLLPLL